MNKRVMAVVVVLLVAIVLVALSGCAKPETPSTEKPAPTPAPTVKPIELKFASFGSTSGPRPEVEQWYGQEVEKRTQGKVKIEYFYMSALLKPTEIPEGVKVGTAEMGSICTAYQPTKYPLSTVNEILVFKSPNPWGPIKGMQAVLSEVPEAKAEFEKTWNQKILFYLAAPDYHIGANTVLKSLADIKGMKIRVPGKGHAKIVEAAEGVPVSLSAPSVYEAIERGTVEGAFTYIELLERYKWAEVAKVVNLLYAGHMINNYGAINLDAWNKIPADLQKIMLEVGEDTSALSIEKMCTGYEAAAIPRMKKDMGVQFVNFPDAEREKWMNLPATKAIATDWIAERNAEGLPGQRVLDVYKAAVGKAAK